MGSARATAAQQSARTSRSLTWLALTGAPAHSHLRAGRNGQHHDSGVRSSPRWSGGPAGTPCPRDSRFLATTRPPPDPHLHTGHPSHAPGSPVPSGNRQKLLAASAGALSSGLQSLSSPTDSGPVRRSPECATPNLRFPIPRPYSPSSGCLFNELAPSPRLSDTLGESTIWSTTASNYEGSTRPRAPVANRARLEVSPMVAADCTPANVQDPHFPRDALHPRSPRRGDQPPAMVVCGGPLGRVLADGPLPPALASVIAEHRWRPSTVDAYGSVWARWEAHCHAINIDPIASPPPLLAALNWLEDRRAAGEINGRTARSHLGTLHQFWALAGTEGLPTIARAITTSWSRSAGPAARYLDVPANALATKLLDRCASDSTVLYERFIVLLRFTELLRAHDVASIVPHSVIFDHESVTFDIRNPKQGDITLRRRIMRNVQRPHLCLMSLFSRIMSIYRHARDRNAFLPSRLRPADSILLASRRPFSPLAPATINKYVQRALLAVGVNPRFKPHSLRHWGASMLAQMGIPTDEILRRGGWSSFRSYALFYNKALASKEFNVIARLYEFMDEAEGLASDDDNDEDDSASEPEGIRSRAAQEAVRLHRRRG
jgi:Phage integrase family